MVVRVSAAAAATPVSAAIVAMVVMVMVVMQVRVLPQMQCSGSDAAAATAGTAAARTARTRARAVRKAERRLGRRGEVLVAAPVRAGLRVEDVRMGIVHGGLGRRFTVADELRMGRLVLVVARVPAGRRRVRQIAAVILRIHREVIVVRNHLDHTSRDHSWTLSFSSATSFLIFIFWRAIRF